MKKTSAVLTMAAIAAVIVTSLALTGCGGAKPTKIVVAPGHKKQFIIDADMAVMVLDTPIVVYFGDLKKSISFTNPPEDLPTEIALWNYFTDGFIRDAAREVDLTNVFMVDARHDFRITREVVRTSEEDITVQVPELGTRFTFDDGVTPALVLFMCQIRVGTETNPYFLERAEVGLNVAVSRRLVYIGSFVLWDNREFKPISYGRVKTTLPIIREEATEANWNEAMRNFVRTIFEPTGFLRRKR